MTDKEQIERMERLIDHRLGVNDVAKALYEDGYHKTVWHKVADGDLPKRESEDVCAIPVQAYYIDSNGMRGNGPLYFFSIDSTFHAIGGPNAINIIAWTELPKYEEVEE